MCIRDSSHSDSPTWRIKTLDGADHGFARAEVEGYGGMLMSTWFDRPLSCLLYTSRCV